MWWRGHNEEDGAKLKMGDIKKMCPNRAKINKFLKRKKMLIDFAE